ncbi:hypothetical protein AY600_04805 [Phormidium willei BDU 130791]|nr:hypothetical protein AY600_04805 [Phormidium willei BDU 130791]
MTDLSSSPWSLPPNKDTWVAHLRHQASHRPNQTAFTFLQDGELAANSWTYGDLDHHSRTIAAHLQALGLSGERALLLYPAGLDYLAAFLGCLYAGVVAVPAYPPQNARKTPRILSIAQDADPKIALTNQAMLPKLQQLMGQHTIQQWLATDSLNPALGDQWQPPDINSDTLAFLQYTSGSTGRPKGVMLTHGNLLHNAQETYRMMGHSPQSCFVSWLPLYHDMGLIGGILQPLYGGFPCVLMSPVAFLQRPYRWLKAISDYQATTSGAPNFAYDLCVDKISAEQRQTLDLTHWQVAFNGAEPVRASTLERFRDAFAPCGFHDKAFYPCYGLAEGTLMVSGTPLHQPPRVHRVRRQDLEQHQASSLAPEDPNEAGQALVSSGISLERQTVVIVNPQTHQSCAAGTVGEIWVKGPSVGQGYWQNPSASEETFGAYLRDSGQGPFLRTGDLGLLHQGQLFVTGRLKDVIILRGRNLYPQDLEQTAETSHETLRLGGSAALTVPVAGQERLVIVQELDFRQKPELPPVMNAIREAVAASHEVDVYDVVLIKPGTLPKTTSGKIQRRACRQAYRQGTLSQLGQSRLAQADSDMMAGAAISRQQLLSRDPEQRRSQLRQWLQQQIAQSLDVAASIVDWELPLTALGLDSLRVMDLKNAIQRDLAIDLPIADFFDNMSGDRLVQQLLDQLDQPENNVSKTAPETTNAATREFPLTPSQQQIAFLHQLQPDSAAYTIAIALDIQGTVDSVRLRESLAAIAQGHPLLRSYWPQGSSQLVACPTLDLPWTDVDLRSQPSQLDAESQTLAQQPFDLSQAPLWRLGCYQLSDQHQRLLLVIHHLIFDGRSAAQFFRELTREYQQRLGDDTMASIVPILPPSPDTRSPIGDRQLNYWRQHLAGELPVLELPSDKPRPAVQRFHGAHESLELPLDQVDALQQLAQDEGVTLFMVLLAAFKTWLYRYSGQTDLLVGAPWRESPSCQGIGCDINTLVLRSQADPELSFRDYLRQVRQVALDAYRHAQLPFQTLVETLQPERDASYSPLVQVMFDLQQFPRQLTWPDATVHLSRVNTNTAKFDLTLSLIDQGQGIQGDWEYNRDRFSPETVQAMIRHFQTLLAGIVANPDCPLSQLPLLSDSERQQILEDWNQTDTAIPDQPVQQLFEAQVQRTPEAVALRYDPEDSEAVALTYQQLNQQANQLAHWLQQQGLGDHPLIGICLPRSPQLLVALLAVLKTRRAYVPLDPSYPPQRLSTMMGDSQITHCLTNSSVLDDLSESCPGLGSIALNLDHRAGAIESASDENPQPSGSLKDLAYVIYTSGSTGQPKGVAIEQRGLVNYLTWCQRAYPLDRGQGTLVHSSISFDMTLTSLLAPLLAGQTVELLPESWGLEALVRGLRRRPGQSLIKITPAQLDLLSQQLTPDELAHCTHAFIIGGENLAAERLRPWRDRAPTTQLINEYGPTETVVGCCVHTVTDQDPDSGRVAIGRPIFNTQLYVLDSQLQPVPIGVVGELYIGGAGVARGYWGRPDLTQERFIANPFDDGRSRLYKTGDLARYGADGRLDCLGRCDRQVKLRGHRIELGEIEAVIRQQTGIREALVLTETTEAGAKRLLAYVVPEGTCDLGSLRTQLSQHLPDIMIPAVFISLKELPLTVNGKVDRRALPTPGGDRPQLSTPYLAPQGQLERTLAQIWQDVLEIDQVGLQDNFFDLGGHSLLLAEVHQRLQQQLNCSLALMDLFRYPTIAALAAALDSSPDPSDNAHDANAAKVRGQRQKAALQRRKLQLSRHQS